LQIPSLNTLYTTAQTEISNVATAKNIFDTVTGDRQLAFEPLKSLATKIFNFLSVTDATDQTIADAKTINNKLQGRRAGNRTENPPPEGGTTQSTVSVSRQSYDSLTENFSAFIDLVASIPTYTPNETELYHWLSFVLILVLIPVGFIMSNMENDGTKLILLCVHILAGVLVFILTLFRVWFFFKHKRPSKLETGSAIHNKLVVWLENSFYFILILLSTSGLATVIFGNFAEAIQNNDASLLAQTVEVPPLMAHKALAIILIILLIGHIGGVINHYIKTKENTIKRITP